MKVIYMGTPDFAVPALKKLHELGAEIPMVYTQPDRPKGRGKKLAPSPVKVAAEELGLPVRQPERLREAEEVEFLKSLAPDMILVAAYGQILPKSVLEIPAHGCINLHASLLPKYRGAAPVEAAILAGEKETGVTVMQMAEGLDTGDLLLVGAIPITEKDTAGILTEKLAEAGANLIRPLLEGLTAGTLSAVPQDDAKSSYAGKITREMGKLDFTDTAVNLSRRIRALNPHHAAYAALSGKNLKILFARVADDVETMRYMDSYKEVGSEPTPGTVLHAGKKGIAVMTGNGVLVITELQPEGKKPMQAVAYLNGYPVGPGELFE